MFFFFFFFALSTFFFVGVFMHIKNNVSKNTFETLYTDYRRETINTEKITNLFRDSARCR